MSRQQPGIWGFISSYLHVDLHGGLTGEWKELCKVKTDPQGNCSGKEKSYLTFWAPLPEILGIKEMIQARFSLLLFSTFTNLKVCHKHIPRAVNNVFQELDLDSLAVTYPSYSSWEEQWIGNCCNCGSRRSFLSQSVSPPLSYCLLGDRQKARRDDRTRRASWELFWALTALESRKTFW